MNPQEILLLSQLASLVAQGITQLVTARKNLSQNASATEQANLDAAHNNFQAVINAAKDLSKA